MPDTIPQEGTIKHTLFGLDHLRTLAITLVFVFHYGRIFPSPSWIKDIGGFGWTGVDLFFVLSGYLIASQLFAKIAKENKIHLREFFIKRFFRIIPAYLLVVGAYLLFPSFRERPAPAPVWKYLTFTQNLGLNIKLQGTFSHAWSLCVEEHFYLFLPLVLATMIYFKLIRRGWLIIAALFLAGFAIRILSWQTHVVPFMDTNQFGINWYMWIYYPTWCRLDGLLAGVAIAALFQFKPVIKERIARKGNLLLILGFAILVLAFFVVEDQYTFTASIVGFPLIAIGYGVLVMGAVSRGSVLFKFSSAITSRIAAWSYGLYLTHKIVIHVLQENLSGAGLEKEGNLMLLICTIACVLVAFLLNIIVEKPFLQLRDKILKAKPSAPKAEIPGTNN